MEIWWLTNRGLGEWTTHERQAWWRIYAVGVPGVLFLVMLSMVICQLFGLGHTLALLVSIGLAGASALFAARMLCDWAWPDLMRQADANAAYRLGGRRV